MNDELSKLLAEHESRNRVLCDEYCFCHDIRTYLCKQQEEVEYDERQCDKQENCEHLSTYVEVQRFEYCSDCDALLATLD